MIYTHLRKSSFCRAEYIWGNIVSFDIVSLHQGSENTIFIEDKSTLTLHYHLYGC